MSDIVERLRFSDFFSEADCLEAAAEIEKLRVELAEYKRNGIVDVTGSINYHSGYDEGVKAERDRCVIIVEDYSEAITPNEEWSKPFADGYETGAADISRFIAAALKETGDE